MSHALLLVVHATAATVALLAGLLALRRRRFLPVHAVATLVMALSLAPSLWLGRATTPLLLRLVFLGLFGLALVMSGRALRTWRSTARPGRPADADHLAVVGFNLIGLVTGFLTVAVLRLGFGTLAVVVVGVGIPVLGHHLLHRAVNVARRLDAVKKPQAPATPAPSAPHVSPARPATDSVSPELGVQGSPSVVSRWGRDSGSAEDLPAG